MLSLICVKEGRDKLKGQTTKRSAYVVLIASIIFNLTIQVLYIWSLLKREMMLGDWGWTSREGGLPYTLIIIFFSIGVLLGGRVQDKIGPRWVATVGGAFVGLGMIISGLLGDDPIGVAIAYGGISGLGIGFGYGSVLPACLKWFHPGKKGLIGGLVLAGFGLASVHYAVITESFLDKFGIQNTLLYIGGAIAVISVIAAQFVKNPPPEYSPVKLEKASLPAVKTVAVDLTWKDMLQTKRFYLIFILFVFSVSMGLMILGNVAKIAIVQTGVESVVFLISLAAVMNAAGRIIGGFLSDKIGRANTLFIVIILQMLNMVGFVFYQNIVALTFGLILTGLCFGTFLTVFPALTADQYGLKNYGFNYGIVYLAYGFAGTVAPVIADYFYDRNGSFNTAYIICAIMMALMLVINLLLKREIS